MKYFYLVAPTAVTRVNENSFTYHSDQPLDLGSLVRVSVGKKIHNGVVLRRVSRPAFATKAITQIVATQPLPPPLVKLALWLSDYYATHLALVLQTMLPAGLHRVRRVSTAVAASPLRKRTNFVLNKDQQRALSVIKNNSSTTLLLHGVTGSGKTQVYIEAAKQQAAQGKSSIILVPEIALTPQLQAEFTHHFERLLITHSGMTEAQRHKVWCAALESKEPCVVIGPRSALFMPLAAVGLIVVDECHEPSYKQEQSPRYSALRAASMLARFHKNAKAILGSATPSLTDYFAATNSNIPILPLSRPAVAIRPATVHVVDFKERSNFKTHRFFSNELLSNLAAAQQKGKQSLLFHNRRGSAPTTLCEQCSWLAECPTCILPLTLHADQHQLRCHVCNFNTAVPPSCPVCHQPTITFKGIGTKLIEAEVKKLFPKATIARFDADTKADAAVHHRYQELYEGSIDIIIGTQMLAKGFDLPHLALVGIVQADSGLLIPDYQADERVFQLVHQVVGRVGRQNHSGHVVIQSFQPEHPTLRAALNKDYTTFYQAELLRRHTAGFPPFRYLLKLTCTYKTEKSAIASSQQLARTLKAAYPSIEILGPAPAFYERLGGTYRWQLIVKSRQRGLLTDIARTTAPPWQFDIDPASLL